MDMLIIFKVYLIYGLACFSIFSSVFFRNLSKSRIHIAGVLPVLAAFGLVHGIHEWSALYLEIFRSESGVFRYIEAFKVVKLWLSFAFLSLFAWKMLNLTSWRYLRWIKGCMMTLLLIFIAGLVLRYDMDASQAYIVSLREQIRWIFALGGGVLSGLAVYSYANILEEEGYGASLPFKLMGLALIGYGCFAGLFSVESGLWVLVCQTFWAICITVTLWYALRVFDRERDSQTEAALHQSLQDAKLKELGELISAVAHEIKTPVSSAMVSCDLLLRQLPDDEAHRRQINRIMNSLTRAAEISHEVLNYAHHKPVKHERVRLCDIIHAAVHLNQYRLAGFDCMMELDEQLVVYGDAGLLEEVISNFISNAIDASQDDDRRIKISCFRDKLNVVVQVLDYGDGMPQDMIGKATQPFFTTKPRGEGTGMGLSLCKQIILRHGGTLLLRNHPEGFVAEMRLPGGNQ
ncbi:Globin-coupled histidine kinase [Vibrio aerogenes CECT 7868]|uniref:histidine kinase n=1 Tax=Vibrio aerogenes CECT 7868 TaxID=1216006 RepID=A0A1M5Z136_9VIBR|nr:HAMP domain-containing sensor histidine kinase [Vibrio aerogenes]SHI18007.1 Globin-coupled histidine kinase [Vibrio aerogenes CECT 7868]